VNHAAFEAVRGELELLLWTLSDDNWTLVFHRTAGAPEAKQSWPQPAGATILFSGGVDSFVGATELLSERGVDAVQLASHITGNRITRQSQENLAAYLRGRFGDSLNRIAVRTGGTKKGDYSYPADADREETQRTRSFMFLAIAALAARRSGHKELVVIAENGQMAIHLPLSPARIGAFSTHTAHPEFVSRAAEFFSRVLDVQFTVRNPYLYSTKAEVVAKLPTPDRAPLSSSVSCWRGARVFSASNHCGECVPCLVRRIAFEFNGINIAEYKTDLFRKDVPSLPEDDEGKRNIVELASFAYEFATRSEAELAFRFPDIINPSFDQAQAIQMYRRFAGEAVTVLRRYSGPTKLLPDLPKKRAAAKKGGSK
jgi:7-cyano-7-deazaguanine synthase in queuosine biosynthesis